MKKLFLIILSVCFIYADKYGIDEIKKSLSVKDRVSTAEKLNKCQKALSIAMEYCNNDNTEGCSLAIKLHGLTTFYDNCSFTDLSKLEMVYDKWFNILENSCVSGDISRCEELKNAIADKNTASNICKISNLNRCDLDVLDKITTNNINKFNSDFINMLSKECKNGNPKACNIIKKDINDTELWNNFSENSYKKCINGDLTICLEAYEFSKNNRKLFKSKNNITEALKIILNKECSEKQNSIACIISYNKFNKESENLMANFIEKANNQCKNSDCIDSFLILAYADISQEYKSQISTPILDNLIKKCLNSDDIELCTQIYNFIDPEYLTIKKIQTNFTFNQLNQTRKQIKFKLCELTDEDYYCELM